MQFRDIRPTRTYSGAERSNYREYKDHLIRDFQNRCGYTYCLDSWFGGRNTFHIDHFRPQKTHEDLINTYSNLVYSCSYVNIAKGRDETPSYLDPCDVDYNDHFERDNMGNIVPKATSPEAQYMYRKMKLYLKRYGIIYTLDRLEKQMESLREIIQTTSSQRAGELFNEVAFAYMDYMKYLRATY